MAESAELETVLNRRRVEVEAKGASYTKDRMGRADAVWYERTEGQFSPRSSDRPISRLASNSPFGFREPSEPPPEMPERPQLVRRRSTDATTLPRPEPDRVRRSFPRRTSTGTALKAPVRPMNSRTASPARSLSSAPSSAPSSRAAVSPEKAPAEAPAAKAQQKELQEAAASKREDSSSSASTISCEAVAAPKRALPKSPPRAAPKSRGNKAPGASTSSNLVEKQSDIEPQSSGVKATPQLPGTISKAGASTSSNLVEKQSDIEPQSSGVKATPQLPGTTSKAGASTSSNLVEKQSDIEPQSSGSLEHQDEPEGGASPTTPPMPMLNIIKRRHVKLSTVESVGDVPDDDTPPAAKPALPCLPDGSEASQGLPTILTRRSESKKSVEETPDPPVDAASPCAEPEPAPSPDAKLEQPGAEPAIQSRGPAFAAATSIRPALVINIPPGDDSTGPEQAKASGSPLDEQEYRVLWQSVVQGDIGMLQEFINRGRLHSGRLCDMNGHSIFWNALAYQQQQVAMFLLHHFPPGSADGIDLMEVHARRKDTLLHLCVYFQYFSAPVAGLFELLFLGMGQVDTNSFQAYWNRVNADQDNFLHCAAARSNFWVMRYVVSHACEMLSQQNGRTSAVEVLLEKLAEVGVTCPTPDAPEMQVPSSWMDFSRYLPSTYGVERSSSFADVELEVQQSSGTYRVAAHRCLLGAASGVFHQELSECPGRSFLIDPLSCRSGEVMDTVLTFIYTSRISCDYTEDGYLLWQLLCFCARYQLPEPLWRYARSALLLAVRNAVFTAVAVIPLLLEAKRDVALSETEARFLAHVYLRKASETGGSKSGEALLLALEELELHAMSVLTT